jgi:hypothetical protein
MVKLLPFIGAQTISNDIQSASQTFKTPAFDLNVSQQTDAGTKRHVSTLNPPKIFQCASFESKAEIPMTSEAPEYAQYSGDGYAVGISNYAALSGTHLSTVLPTQQRTGRGPAPPPKPNGVIVYRANDEGVRRVGDGESQTVVAVETREPNYASWYDGTTAWVVAHNPKTREPELRAIGNKSKLVCDGDCAHSINVGPDANGLGPKYRETWAGQQAWQFGPSSQHSGGQVNHLFADKHVGQINQSIDATVYMHLVTREGSEVIDASF